MVGIGLDYDKLGKPEEAKKWFNKALSTDPSIAKSLANSGLALSNSTEYREVVGWLDRVILTDLSK
jgi:tetratricopeptide (TPR) repeat protein